MTRAKLLATALDEPRVFAAASGGVQAGAVFAGHRLIEELGRGGMGIVFTACHLATNRIVALKVPHANSTPDLLQRFRAEAEAAAALAHPGILTVHEVGESNGVPYLTMQFAECGSLADRLETFTGKPRAVAELVARIAGAVQHAHERGLLHRDLKPSNILLAAPDQPLVADFGLARWLGRESDLTQSLTLLGTPDYMAPEAVRGARHALTTAADVFSLGAILYHLLAGEQPFRGATVAETLRRVAEESPRAFDRTVPRDLAAICMKCLERDPTRRFPSARDLADDLARFLRGEPIRARPAPPLEKAWRWCRRRPALASLLAILLVVLVVAFVMVEAARRAEAGAKIRAEHASQQLREANKRTGESLDLSELERAEQYFEAGDSVQALGLLARVARRNPTHPTAGQRLASALWQGDFIMPRGAPFFGGGKVTQLHFLSDGVTLLVATERGAGLWNGATGLRVATFEHDGNLLWDAAVSADERTLAGWDGEAGRTHVFWDVATGRRFAPPAPHAALMRALALAPDGSVFLPVTPGDAAAAVQLRDCHTDAVVGETMMHPHGLSCAAFSTDGTALATAEGLTVRVWEVRTQRLRCEAAPLDVVVSKVQFSPDSRWILAACFDGTMRFISAQDGSMADGIMRHEAEVNSFAFSSDGQRLLAASDDHTARIWSVPDGAALGPPMRHRDAVRFAVFSPDDAKVVTCSRDNSSRLWDARTGRPLSQPLRSAEQPRVATFSADASTLYIGGTEAAVQRWDVRATAPAPVLLASQSGVSFAEFSADGNLAVTASTDGSAAVWKTAPGRRVGALQNDTSKLHVARFSPSAQWFATGSESGQAWVHGLGVNPETIGPFEHAAAVIDVCVSPDERRLATACVDGSARVWDIATRAPITSPLMIPREGRRHHGTVRFSPDGHALLTAIDANAARLWNIATGQPIGAALEHIDRVNVAEFSPDGRFVATASHDNTARVWDAHTGAPVSPPLRHTRTVAAVAFSRDGTRVATASWDNTARIWDARTGQPRGYAMTHNDHVLDVQFSADGRRIVTASRDKAARLWDAITGLPISEPLRHSGAVERARFHPDNVHVLTTSADAARIWEVPDFNAPPPAWLLDLAEFIARGEQPATYQAASARMPINFENAPAGAAFARIATRFFAP